MTISNKMEAVKDIPCLVFLYAHILSAVVPLACGDDPSSIIPVLPHLCYRKVPERKINTALLNIEMGKAVYDKPLILYLQSEQCYKCHLIPSTKVRRNCSLLIDSRWAVRMELRQQINNSTIVFLTESCRERNLTKLYTEGAEYTIYLDVDGSNITCNMMMVENAADAFIPIYVALSIGFFLAVLWTAGKYLYRKRYIHHILCFWSAENMMSDLGTPTNISQADDSSSGTRPIVEERLKSLDTFRGLAICIMIFVNYGGGDYWFFSHSTWNGLTVADLAFPWFVFIMGTATVFSFQSQLRRNVPKWKIFVKILKRSAVLFLLGLLVNSFDVHNGVDFTNFRVPGVLQRFAGTYLITATVYIFIAPVQKPKEFVRFAVFQDVILYWPEWLVCIAFIILHSSLTMYMPVPGCPRGYLGPGGFHYGGNYFNCTGGAAGYIDRMFFGSAHIYQSPTCKEIYGSTVPHDPEGLLGTLTSCVLCFFGLQAGKILHIHNDWVKRCRRFVIWSVLLAGLGALLCEFSLNDGWIPVNKNLWSLSYVFVTSGMAFFGFMVCYILIDVYKIWSGAPFLFAGMNSIALYCGHEFFNGQAPVSFQVSQSHVALLALNIWGTAFWLLVSVYFYYKNIFISV